MVGIPGALHYLLSEASVVYGAAIAVAFAAVLVFSFSAWFVS